MLLAMMDYAAKIYSNLSATTADPLPTTTMPTIATTKLSHNGISTTTPTATTPTIANLDTINATVKSIVKNTLIKVAKTNMTDYTAQYSLPPDGLGPDPHGAVGSGGQHGGYSGSNAMQATRPDQVGSFPTQTVATFIAGNKNRATTIIVYPTVSPESIVIPIVSCIFGFPILALIVICCLRRRAKLARERDRRRNYDMQDHAVSLVRFSPIHRLNYRSSRAISLRPERSLSQGFTSLELDTVMEERSDIEQTQTEMLNAESPLETTSLKMSFSS